MKRVLLSIVLALLLAAVLSPPALAEYEYKNIETDTGKVEAAVPESAKKLMEGVSAEPGENFAAAFEKILLNLKADAEEAAKEPVKSAVLIICVAVICGVVGVMYAPAGNFDALKLSSVLAVAAIAAGDIGNCVGLGRQMITELSEFSKVLLPTLTAAAAVSGAVTSAAAKYAAAALFMDILITCVESLLIPLIYAYIAAMIAQCALGGEGLSGAASLLKWAATSILTLIVLAFVVYLSISGLVSGSADAATVRVAKTAISTTLPVVGGIISDAASTVLLGASVIKSSVGAFGLLTVAAVCLTPLIKLAGHYLMYKCAAKLSSAICGGAIAKAAGGIGSAFGLVMGAMGACTIMLFISIISFVQAVI